MKILSITLKDRMEIPIKKLTLLVGPNNAGKSQILKDICKKLTIGHKSESILIDSIKVERPSTFEKLFEGLDIKPDDVSIGNHKIDGMVMNNYANDKAVSIQLEAHKNTFNSKQEHDYTFLGLGKYHVFYLDSESRLKIASKSSNYIPGESSPKNFLQALYGSVGAYDKELCDAFNATFGMNIRLDYSAGMELRLAVAKLFGDIPEDARKAYPIMKKHPSIEYQGDGFRSFVAVVLTLLLSKDKVVLLDEPEAFLHPEQARRLGKWISDQAESFPCQIIIATHNSNFLVGMLSGKQAADIYRLNRQENKTKFTKITSEATKSLATSPVLSSQRILESIFARGVVVCEADSDRIFYNTVAIKECDNQEILFVHAHNKQTIKLVVELLGRASIPVACIVDLDILNSASELSDLISSFDGSQDISRIIALQREVSLHIEGGTDEAVLESIKSGIQELSKQIECKEHTLKGARSALERIKMESSKWTTLKKQGISSLVEPIQGKSREVIEFCALHGIFLVPGGELECWIPLGVKKKKWIVPALEELHRGKCPNELKEFVQNIISYIDKKAKLVPT